MENLSTPVVDNALAQLEVPGDVNAGIVSHETSAPVVTETVAVPDLSASSSKASWKSYLRPDLKESPLSKKFEVTRCNNAKMFKIRFVQLVTEC